MPPSQREDTFSLGVDILGTRQNERGTMLAQTGDVIGEGVSSVDAEFWQHVGFASRPAKAVVGKDACQAITINTGSADVVIATRDLRANALIGTLKEGDTLIYAAGPANAGTAKLLLSGDGSVTVTAGGTTVVIKGDSVAVNSGKVNLGNGAAEGVVCGGSAFQQWASNIEGAVSALIQSVGATPTAVGAPVDPTVLTRATGLTFPAGEISSSVKAST